VGARIKETNTLNVYSCWSLRLTGRRLIPIIVDNCRVEHRSMGSYVSFMHRCRARRLAKYRQQPHRNSGHDSDQRQLVRSVLRTMDTDLSVSRRSFFEKIPKGRGYSYACQNNLYKQTSSKERSDIVSQVRCKSLQRLDQTE